MSRRISLAALAFVLLFSGTFFLVPTAALADGASCWCRDQAWVCSHFQANRVIPGGTVGDIITQEQCQAFCAGRHTNGRTEATYTRSFCREGCVEGGSCTTEADPGLTGLTPAQNTCILEDRAIQLNVTSLADCCRLNQDSSGAPPERVGYSGRVQNCPANPDAAPTAVTSSGPIRLFNPLGRDTDIPSFIGRGIRGVLGVIGAIALLMFVYGGVVWMTAGDSKRVEDAKNIIKNSVIGLLLIFFSYNLIGIFFDFFT